MRKAILALVLMGIVAGAGLGQQLPPVGIVDLYGLRKLSETQVLQALGVKPGDAAFAVLRSQDDILRRLRSLPGVEAAAVEVVCCTDADGRSMVFVGIREKGTPALAFRDVPRGSASLPAEIVKAGEDFQKAFQKSLEARDFSEDDSNGYALFGNQGVREVQQQFVTLATPNYQILRRVLRESSDPRQRALAAQVIAYADDKPAIVDDLAFAMNDPDTTTRNNALRSLLVLAKYARSNPRLNLKIPTLPFVRLLNSLSWTDRNKSAGALDTLTLSRDPGLLAELRREALDSLAEMARWHNPGHARPSFNILARVAGLSEDEIAKAWSSPDREKQVPTLLQKIRGKRLPGVAANALRLSNETVASATNVI